MPETKNDPTYNLSISKKSIFSQLLAGIAQNLLLLDLGVAVSFPTIIIPALLGADGPMSFTKEQASWFGSISSIMQPIGSLFSGVTLEPLGRKKSLLLVNIPHIIAWLMIYFSKNVTTVFIANALLGMGIGFMEAPIITYIGEISHPSIRGTLSSFSQIFTTSGVFLAYLFGSVMDWRTAALASLAIPIITFFTIFLIPETPIWLISKGKHDEAINALCWVRGWAKPEDVKIEFDELVVYQKNSVKCELCPPSLSINDICSHKNNNLVDRIKSIFNNMTRKEMLRPLSLVMMMFIFYHTTGLNPIKPNMVNLYRCFGFIVDPYLATVITGIIGILGTILLMFIIKLLGKRFLNLISLTLCSMTTLFLGLYAFLILPAGTSSYSIAEVMHNPYSWIPMMLFVMFNIFSAIGIGVMPWIMLSEVFPLRGRGFACGIAAAFAYIVGSITTKTYYNLETSLGIYGAFWFYSFCSLIGSILLYLFMPETEGKSFEEIEKYFSREHVSIIANDPITNKFIKRRYKNKNTTQSESNK